MMKITRKDYTIFLLHSKSIMRLIINNLPLSILAIGSEKIVDSFQAVLPGFDVSAMLQYLTLS